jgi:formylmethanofuran dehydrogenase subunit E
VDAIQYFTGCTFGKGNLIHRDYGKNAFTFVRRSDGKAIRIVARPDAWGPPDPEREALLKRVREGKASEADQQRAQRLRQERLEAILAAPARQIFEVQAVEPAAPERARLYESMACAGCGEMVMETRVRLLQGQPYCIPCFETRERRL